MVDKTFRPTILVGVGGTGCKIAESVYKGALAQETGLQGKIAVLGFDTDLNDMSQLKSIERSNQFRFSSTDRLRDYIHKNKSIVGDFMVSEDLLPQRLLNKSLIEGAGQIRMLSHLGLYTELVSADTEQRVASTIASLARMDNTENFQGFVNVMMVGSLAGATGSGSFIQIAMLLKRAAKSIEIDVRGIFLLPDVYVNAASLPEGQIPNVRGSGYAALKELNAVNVIAEAKDENLNFRYEYSPGNHVGKSNFPFESVTLIDFETTEGRSLGRSLRSYLGMCERAVYQQIFSPIGGRMRSIEVNDSRQLLFAAAEGVHNIYSGVGISAVMYPFDHNGAYLTRRFALDLLKGDWTRLDRQFQDKMNAHLLQRAANNNQSKAPVKRDSYLEDLQLLAISERVAFFVDIHEKLNPVLEDERGKTRQTSLAAKFLIEINEKVTRDFWSLKDLNGAGRRGDIVPETLANLSAMVGDVQGLERGMDRDLATLDDMLRDKPRDLLTNTLSNADSMGEQNWQGYHLQSYIVKEGPHVVQVRAFLYAVQQMIEKRLGELDPEAAKKKVFTLGGHLDEDADKTRSQRSSPGTITAATKAAKGNLWGRIRGRRDGGTFADEYSNYYNNSQKAMRKYADEAIELGMLLELRKEIDLLEDVVSDMFTEIDSIIADLEKYCSEEATKYDNLASLDGNYWVYGSSTAKDQMWQTLHSRIAGGGDEAGVNARLSDAIYKKYRADKTPGLTKQPQPIRELFEETVIDGYATERVQVESRSVFDMSVVQAVQNEAKLLGEDWEMKLKEIVRIVGAQSQPLLGIKDPQRNGQRIMFWTVNTKLEEQINDNALFQEMFTQNQGEAPVVLDEFSTYELTCMNTLVNLDLNQLSKLSTQDEVMGIPGNKGIYFAEYEKMVNGLLADGASEKKSGHFTPHIHKGWHVPGMLPEIDPIAHEIFVSKVSKGLVVARALGLMSSVTEYGNTAIVYSSVGRRRTGGIHVVVAQGSDWYLASKEFEKNPALADDALAFWEETLSIMSDERRRPVDSADLSFAHTSLINADFLTRLLEISATRIETDQRDKKTTDTIAAWAELVEEMVEKYRGDMGLVGRKQETDRLVEETQFEAIGIMKQHLPSEIVRTIELAVGRGLESYHSRTGS